MATPFPESCAPLFKNLVADMSPGREHDYTTTGAQQFCAQGKNVSRKLLEIFCARRIEEISATKDLGALPQPDFIFGGGLYGAEAASARLFRQTCARMSLSECATLAGLIKARTALTLDGQGKASRDARNYALIECATSVH